MSQCRLIICEKSNQWAAALRLALGNRPPRVIETRSLGGCEEALAHSSASLVAIETTATNLEAVIGQITKLGQRFPHASVVALVGPELPSAAALLREAGAIDAITSVLQAPRVVRLARRQFALVPDQEVDLEQFVSDRMPWSANATT